MSIANFKKILKFCYILDIFVRKGYLRDIFAPFCYNEIGKRGDFMRDIGKNIKDLRIANGLTQDQLAEKLFVTRQTVSNYENGKSRPDIDMLAKISDVLECDVDSILYGTPSNSNKKREYIKLAVGIALIISVYFLGKSLAPLARRIQGLHYLSAFNFFIAFTLVPLLWLLIGWTIMQFSSFAFKNKICMPSWIRYIRYALIGFISVFFLIVITTLLPTVISDLLYISRKANDITAVYISYVPEKIANISELIINRLINLFVFPYNLSVPVFLSCGILLWLCGFPQTKKSGNTEKPTA